MPVEPRRFCMARTPAPCCTATSRWDSARWEELLCDGVPAAPPMSDVWRLGLRMGEPTARSTPRSPNANASSASTSSKFPSSSHISSSSSTPSALRRCSALLACSSFSVRPFMPAMAFNGAFLSSSNSRAARAAMRPKMTPRTRRNADISPMSNQPSKNKWLSTSGPFAAASCAKAGRTCSRSVRTMARADVSVRAEALALFGHSARGDWACTNWPRRTSRKPSPSSSEKCAALPSPAPEGMFSVAGSVSRGSVPAGAGVKAPRRRAPSKMFSSRAFRKDRESTMSSTYCVKLSGASPDTASPPAPNREWYKPHVDRKRCCTSPTEVIWSSSTACRRKKNTKNRINVDTIMEMTEDRNTRCTVRSGAMPVVSDEDTMTCSMAMVELTAVLRVPTVM